MSHLLKHCTFFQHPSLPWIFNLVFYNTSIPSTFKLDIFFSTLKLSSGGWLPSVHLHLPSYSHQPPVVSSSFSYSFKTWTLHLQAVLFVLCVWDHLPLLLTCQHSTFHSGLSSNITCCGDLFLTSREGCVVTVDMCDHRAWYFTSFNTCSALLSLLP